MRREMIARGVLCGMLAACIAAFATEEAQAAPGDPPPYASLFTKAFEPGWSVEFDDSLKDEPPRMVKLALRINELGKLKIVSGRICAADPFVGLETRPLAEPIPNGEFPVRLAVIEGTLGEGRVAFARVEFSSEPVVRWKMAHIDGANPSTLNEGEILGYGVDSGLGAFFDPEAGKAVSADPKVRDETTARWLEEGESGGKAERGGHGFRLLAPAGPANIAAFDSGWGDGHYASWFGLDANGRVAALLTDFDAIDWTRARY